MVVFVCSLYRALLDPTQYTVIHNPVEGDETNSVECAFEQALEQEFTVIVVEPIDLGHRCIKWIRVGNFLHKSAVLSSFAILAITPFIPVRISLFTSVPLGVFGLSCVTIYGVSWQFDPCCKYQVDYKGRELTKIPSRDIHTPSPVVLVRRNDKYRKIVHNTLSVAVMCYLGCILYKHFTSVI